jgi:hypothetical protein
MKQAAQARQPIPEAIANAPELMMGLELYLDAFFDLNSERQIGFGGAGPIPITKVLEYCRLCEFSEDQKEDLLFYLPLMDEAWGEWNKKKTPKPEPTKGK